MGSSRCGDGKRCKIDRESNVATIRRKCSQVDAAKKIGWYRKAPLVMGEKCLCGNGEGKAGTQGGRRGPLLLSISKSQSQYRTRTGANSAQGRPRAARAGKAHHHAHHTTLKPKQDASKDAAKLTGSFVGTTMVLVEAKRRLSLRPGGTLRGTVVLAEPTRQDVKRGRACA